MICDPNWREYMIWFVGFYFTFRRWTIVQLEKHKGQGEFIQSYLRTELAITLRAAECYADNYTAWSHRAWLVDRFMYDKKKVIWIHTCLTHKLLNPLSPNSDQHQISPCNINALENRVVMRTRDMITEDEFAWYFINFSPLLL